MPHPLRSYLSFIVEGEGCRDALVTTLHRKGLFLAWAWNAVPALYRAFSNAFPCGASESLFLANHVCHIPLENYVSAPRRRALIQAIRHVLGRKDSPCGIDSYQVDGHTGHTARRRTVHKPAMWCFTGPTIVKSSSGFSALTLLMRRFRISPTHCFVRRLTTCWRSSPDVYFLVAASSR